MSINTFEIQSAESDFSRHLALMNEFKNGVEDIEELETHSLRIRKDTSSAGFAHKSKLSLGHLSNRGLYDFSCLTDFEQPNILLG